MTTISIGDTAAVYSPLHSTVTVTPAGRASWHLTDREGTSVERGLISAATDIDMEPGGTLYLRAIEG